MKAKVRWSKEPKDKDYQAAAGYLSLIFGPTRAKTIIRSLRAAPMERYVARDLMRAANYAPTAYDDKAQHKEIKKGRSFAPLLAVRHTTDARLIIADGYHRLGAVCEVNPEGAVPCKIA
jgi:hypothetical protein